MIIIMLLDQEVELVWRFKIKDYYIDKGYKFTKSLDNFYVDVKDIKSNSMCIIKYKCDYCDNEYDIKFTTYFNKRSKFDNKDVCDNCHDKYYEEKRLLKHSNSIKDKKQILQKKLLEFINLYDYLPKNSELVVFCNINYYFFKKFYNNMDELLIDVNINRYDFYIQKVKSLLKKKEINNYKDFNWHINKIPSSKWFIENCPNKSVYDYNSFMEYYGLKPNRDISKDFTIKIIYNMQNKLDRPLMYSDFKNPKENEIGISTIIRYWGTMNKMKEDLSLEIVQESMTDKQRHTEDLKKDLIKLCQIIFNKEGRKTILRSDINNSDFCLAFSTYEKVFKDNNLSVQKFIESIGFKVQKAGRGLNFTFKDGEEVMSSYELYFSNYLKDVLNLQYNIDYFRDVKYETFIESYSKKLDCDYVINFKNKIIYIEIAGILRDYKKHFLKDMVINSKSKERYRLKLKEKEKMLKENNLKYYILFPSDLNEKVLREIFS